jgi:hypothetical protein
MRTFNRNEWKLVGHFGVDAGLCWIGDPCYILHAEDGFPASVGKDWGDFCSGLGDAYPVLKSYPYGDSEHEGLGVCVSTGDGDGSYPVYVRIKDNRVAAVIIDFFGTIFPDDDED